MKTPRSGMFIETALIAFFAGTVSCVVTAAFFMPDSPLPAPHAESSGARPGEGESVAESLARIETRISSLHTRLANQDQPRDPGAGSSTDEVLAKVLERLEAIERFLAAPERNKDVGNVDWASALDKNLAGCLLEHGKTPFDAGVAPLLAQVTRDLAATEDEYAESRRLLKARHKQLLEEAFARSGGQLEKWAPPKGELKALTDARKARRDSALARFRSALAALN